MPLWKKLTLIVVPLSSRNGMKAQNLYKI